MRTFAKIVAVLAAFGMAGVASAQMNSAMPDNSMSNSMMSGKGMPMTDADMQKWRSCQAMSQKMMMKDKKCMALKKKNDMMK